ncbi:hypothetical protein SAMN04488564_1304 [Lentzea waywayandensis]|uniref:Uncharacterized protein n=1 Tax=Lentzea waywayandensis TaxID=84724 RepID=A0A1I6FJQ2_9PSEU|nr:hypothetical protein [Lentzea waywayandensis]SFR30155.1 hypothetical protein SAMN04488564_1304 [Lentzea waywayandensis]
MSGTDFLHLGVSIAGVGPVHLPMPRVPFDPNGPAVPTTVSGPPPADPDEHARFRWWLGHQLTFCVWRLLAESLTAVAAGEARAVEAAELYEAYSVLLRYTGSCSPEVYGRVIRPLMARADPAFSGRWASDHEDIPGLLREVRRVRPAREVSTLVAAARTSQVMHVAQAKRLVGSGASLLRQSSRHDQPVTDRDRAIFDAFFLLTRTPISRTGFTAQFDVLIALALVDLADRPLVHDGEPTTRSQRESVAVLRSLSPLRKVSC